MEKPAAPATPRPSGTAVLIRDGAAGLEVLLLHRADKSAHGDWVFPGGKVEPGDIVSGDAGSVGSALRAAIRETQEEAGVDLAGVALPTIARWITPEIRPKRFDTWFFLGALEADRAVVVCNSEMTEHRWLTPGAALDLHHAKEFALAPPQFVTLSWLADFERAERALRELPARPLVTFRPLPLKLEDGMCMLYDGDAGYATRDAFAPGPRHRISVLSSGTRYERG
ncbi:MAG: NUDIX hydrolase [Deltaproteobacteria bacterium]|nr:NUDIX hydrolase [Deltaproteobacteria bacterium]